MSMRKVTSLTASLSFILMVITSIVLYIVPPFSWVLDFNTALNDAGARKSGEPPYGHAELSSLETFAKKVGIDTTVAQQRMEKAGYQVPAGAQTLKALASANSTTPKALYQGMQMDSPVSSDPKGLPDALPPGTGRLTLAEICSRYGLNIPTFLAELETKNISAEETDSLREIAQRPGMGAADLYGFIRFTVNAAQ